MYSLFSCLSQASCLLSVHTDETGRGMPTLEILLRDPHSFCFRLGFEFLISCGMLSAFGEFIIHAIWHGNLVKFEKLGSAVWSVTRAHNVDFSIKRVVINLSTDIFIRKAGVWDQQFVTEVQTENLAIGTPNQRTPNRNTVKCFVSEHN